MRTGCTETSDPLLMLYLEKQGIRRISHKQQCWELKILNLSNVSFSCYLICYNIIIFTDITTGDSQMLEHLIQYTCLAKKSKDIPLVQLIFFLCFSRSEKFIHVIN